MAKNDVVDTRELKIKLAELKRSVSGHAMRQSLLAGGSVVEAEAKNNILYEGLIDEGRLRASIAAEAITDNEVLIGTNVVYAAIHEFGGTITPKRAKYLRFYWKEIGQWVTTKKVTIPPRPYLRPALDENKDQIVAAFRSTMSSFIGKVLS